MTNTTITPTIIIIDENAGKKNLHKKQKKYAQSQGSNLHDENRKNVWLL